MARFDFIRYANCWEDADVLLEGLGVKPLGNYLSIASAGDNTLSILSQGAGLVLAVDLNPAQLACLELRAAAFKLLDYPGLLEFLGVHNPRGAGKKRLETFRLLKQDLSADSRKYWDNELKKISRGVIHGGKFEKYFRLFRRVVLPLLMSGKNRKAMTAEKTREERQRFYEKVVDTRRWKLLFRMFFGRSVMGSLGRDPDFFKYVELEPSVRIRERARYALCELPVHQNAYLAYITQGNFGPALPHYLRPENFEKIRANLGALKICRGSVRDALDQNPETRFDGFNLSDIFEYMGPEVFEAEYRRILDSTAPGGRLVYWNMMVTRQGSQLPRNRVKYLEDLSKSLFMKDQAFFYKDLRVEEVL